MFFAGLAAASAALLVGCLSSNTEAALQLAPAIFVPQILFAGFFIHISQIPVALRWIQYVCALKYGINLLLIIEFSPPATNDWEPAFKEQARDVLKYNEIKKSDWILYGAILIAMTIGFRLVGIVALTRRARKHSA